MQKKDQNRSVSLEDQVIANTTGEDWHLTLYFPAKSTIIHMTVKVSYLSASWKLGD